ncbi:hypothetical protein [Streptomyces sp. MnatMP-M17]|uniref:hypothetical protein n=1 Tax=unclassified Streptomyces TaxID=2593676 RepID=UPI00081D79BF|nr:hypothetical protein [Streptomyces sp. MnatMP-M17]MYZ36909.1 hypothetical protein [Streptomyces sp. SID4917]SCF87184.1 hypothetical protein GA0115259_103958 [Streptomyces sp. MnatMP-M17]
MQKLLRTSVATAGLVTALALALTGCGGDSGGDSGKDKGGADAPSASADGSGSGPDAGASASTGSGGDGASAVEGSWAGLTDGKAVALSVKAGKVALVADSHVCQGSVEDMGEPMLSLTCADGNTDRTMGSIKSNDGKTLVIAWDKGKKDTLAKTETGTPPEGLPEDLPTDLPVS